MGVLNWMELAKDEKKMEAKIHTGLQCQLTYKLMRGSNNCTILTLISKQFLNKLYVKELQNDYFQASRAAVHTYMQYALHSLEKKLILLEYCLLFYFNDTVLSICLHALNELRIIITVISIISYSLTIILIIKANIF